ncbi:prolyl oligopeptidase family serine peptidase [Ectothiorhodospira sp. BSL-9]|uniref:S9 family peptidase n=1 Tax=Ectothiorhodospira sp. BSL-9 TaxID=1442136 RepID=UPI0007B43975|nr:prolyl oligopeptidase family serine peptidase [Ectothiorhodospira sp. BSL-9]ANB02844.1 hypothetical protein ECTOBSL9_2346 [Ectothiorhodospira sp. BSL-9]
MVQPPEGPQRLIVADLETLETREIGEAECFDSRPLWHPDGEQLAVIRRVTAPSDTARAGLAVYGVAEGVGLLHALDQRWEALCAARSCVLGERIRGVGRLRWADDGRRLIFGVGLTGVAADEALPEGLAVWHWRDDPISPRRQRQRDGSKLLIVAAWSPEEGSLANLAEIGPHRSAQLLSGERHLLVQDARPYLPHFGERWHDFHVVDVTDGIAVPVVTRQEEVGGSSTGRYLMYFRDDQWWTLDLQTGRVVSLTGDLSAPFNDYTRVSGREQDQAFGHGQWAADDRWVLLYSRFDVYRVSPDGGRVERLTQGRENRIRFRQHRLDWHADPPDDTSALYFSAFNEQDKSHGYLRYNPDEGARWLLNQPRRLRFLQKAEAADAFVVMAESATESPNFHFTNDDFHTLKRVTNTNPQQSAFHWGGDELLHYESERGQPLQGRLLYPAGYEPGRRYPMVVLIYEDRSDNLHSYHPPRLSGLFNQRILSAEEYFVLEPDIAYELNRPGLSSMESIRPAVRAALDTGMIDPDAVALVGHSWGGYQTAFAITQTDLFSAAIAAAPVTNLVSQYNAVYRRTGQPNANIFETGQGRLTSLFWETPGPYLANSPVFHAHRSNTPLLMVFGTDDDAVDFSQGVELYNVMRRSQRPVVMLAYEGEGHSFRDQDNREDATRRKLQWLDHHLKGAEGQPWMSGANQFMPATMQRAAAYVDSAGSDKDTP